MIIEATLPEQINEARTLFLEYAAGLGFSLCFQNFQQELDTLPGKYAPPLGVLLLAAQEPGGPAGCVGVRPLTDNTCEMKRLYVRPQLRNTGLGRQLVNAALSEARSRRYRSIMLDTVPGKMDRAIRLYRSLGFQERPPYYDSAIKDTLFFELTL